MNPYLLENLYIHLGKPVWFWPAVFLALLLLLGLAGGIAPAEASTLTAAMLAPEPTDLLPSTQALAECLLILVVFIVALLVAVNLALAKRDAKQLEDQIEQFGIGSTFVPPCGPGMCAGNRSCADKHCQGHPQNHPKFN